MSNFLNGFIHELVKEAGTGHPLFNALSRGSTLLGQKVQGMATRVSKAGQRARTQAKRGAGLKKTLKKSAQQLGRPVPAPPPPAPKPPATPGKTMERKLPKPPKPVTPPPAGAPKPMPMPGQGTQAQPLGKAAEAIKQAISGGDMPGYEGSGGTQYHAGRWGGHSFLDRKATEDKRNPVYKKQAGAPPTSEGAGRMIKAVLDEAQHRGHKNVRQNEDPRGVSDQKYGTGSPPKKGIGTSPVRSK